MNNITKFVYEAVSQSSTPSRWSLKRRLFSYMMLLVCLLLLFLVTALFLTDQFDNIEENTYDALEMQIKVFEKDITDHFDAVAAAGISLSQSVTELVEDYLSERDIRFSELTDNADAIAALQSTLLKPLLQQLSQENCSGIYVILDTTVNSSLAHAASSRAGIYLQTNGYKSSYNPIVLLRGNAEVGRENDIMPHRKWTLEFDTSILPEFEALSQRTALPITKSFCFTETITIPRTETRMMLLCVPMVGTDGTFLGICGFEISESYFASYYAQPTKVDHLTYLFLPSPSEEDSINITSGFSCGDTDGYYRVPQGVLTSRAEGHGLYSFHGDAIPYLGITGQITLSPNNPEYTIGVLMRKADYDLEKRTETIKNVSLWSVLLIAAVGSCYYFSRRFLSPILHSLEQLKTEEEVTAFSNIPEIADLFEFLSEKDRMHEESLSELAEEKQTAESEKESILQEYERVQLEYLETQRKLRDAEHSLNETQEEHKSTQTEFEKAQMELQRLAYSRQAEIDPDAYIQFLDGIETLTPTERKIFNYYLDGLNVKEIAETISVKESTVYSHNKNIYSKLGINSLKQLLRYSALMRQQEKEHT